jgi:ATP-dependent 26S proteasome regulatory subunit
LEENQLTESVKTWIEDLVLGRKAQNSNVYLVESLDFTRQEQFKEQLTNGSFAKLIGRQYDKIVEHDIQRQTIVELLPDATNPRTGELESGKTRDEQIDAMGPYMTLDKQLREGKTVCLIKYVILPGHAEGLSNVIVPWSHDQKLYYNMSTVVIFTASLSLFNDNVKRLCYQITIPPSSADERRALLNNVCQGLSEIAEKKFRQKISLEPTSQIINASSGLTLHDTETAALESYFVHRRLEVSVFTAYKVKILRNYGIEWVEAKRGFDSVGGYSYLKEYTQKRVINVINNPEVAKIYGLEIPRGMLLVGPPGTGKTYFAKALAKEIGLPMLKISPADFLRGIVGESEQRVRQVTNLIETLTPCLVFIDEFDQLAMKREGQFSGDSGVSRRMQNGLLDWLGDENRKSFVIGATNFIDLDPAFIRPGRIDEIILVLPPDNDARQQILNVHIKGRKIPVAELDLAAISKETYLWSGAELERLVKEAAALAMEQSAKQVTQDHFLNAIKSFEVNMTERTKNIQGMVAQIKRLEQVNQKFLNDALNAFVVKDEAVDSRMKGFANGMMASDMAAV